MDWREEEAREIAQEIRAMDTWDMELLKNYAPLRTWKKSGSKRTEKHLKKWQTKPLKHSELNCTKTQEEENMKINGIGIVSKKVAMGILTREGREAVKNGDITLEELGEMYKLNQVKKCSKIGTCGDTFRVNYNRIPDSLKESLSPEDLGSLVDAFCQCYGDGKNAQE